MLNKNNEDSIKSIVINKWVEEEGMSPDGAELRWSIVSNDIVNMATPDRYYISEVPETYDALVAMFDFSTAVQEYTLRLMNDKRFRRKVKNVHNKGTMVKHVINEMRSKSSRFSRKSWLKVTSDMFLSDTVQYAITNVGLKNNSHINGLELVKRSYAGIFRKKKGSPLVMDYDNDKIVIPNLDGSSGIPLNIDGLIKRSTLRNIRLIKGDGDRLMVCVHHKDHNDKEHINRQRLIAKRAGIDLDAIQQWEKESTMKAKNNLQDLFSNASTASNDDC